MAWLYFTFITFQSLLFASSAYFNGFHDQSYQYTNETVHLNRSDLNYFRAFQTIYGSSSSIVIPTDTMLRCSADRSCAGISSILFQGADGRLRCFGSYSCAFIQRIQSLDDYSVSLDVYGYNSLEGSFVEAPSVALNCWAQMGCANSKISTGRFVVASGAFSLMNTTIESMGNIDITLSGYYAAYGATIHCNEGHECTINCQSITGCFGMHLICDGACQINSLSEKAMLPIANMSEFDANANISVPIEHSSKCFNYTLDSYYEGTLDIVLNDFVGPVCCRGSYSCADISISYSVPNNNNVAILWCVGGDSCSSSQQIDVSGDVHCAGKEACQARNIANATNVYCSGYNSCWFSNIVSGPTPADFVYRSGFYPNPTASMNIWCSGEGGCKSAIVHIERGYLLSLHLLGRLSGFMMNVNCEGGSICKIYCYAGESCKNVLLDGYGIFIVECNELSLCPIGYTYTKEPTSSPTNKPTMSPTLFPTTNMFSPTFYPIIVTEMDIETSTTSVLINEVSKDNTEKDMESENIQSLPTEVLMLICGVILVLCSLFVVVYCVRSKCRWQTKGDTSMNVQITTPSTTCTYIEKTENVKNNSSEQIIPGANEGNDDETDDDELYGNKVTEGNEYSNQMVLDCEQMYDTQNHTITPGTTTKGDEYTHTAQGNTVTVRGGDDL